MAFTVLPGSGFGSGAFKKITSIIPEFGASEVFARGNTGSLNPYASEQARSQSTRSNLPQDSNQSYYQASNNFTAPIPANRQPQINNSNGGGGAGGDGLPQAESFEGGNRNENFDSFRPGGGYNREVNSDSDYEDYLNWVEDQQKQYQRDVDNTFNEGNKYLNNTEASLRAGKDDFIKQFTGQFEAQRPLLEQARDTGMGQIETNRANEMERERSALGAARQLYNELSQGTRARFGSGALSSAGQASTELLGRETAKNFGNVREATAQTMRTLEESGRRIETEFQAKTQALEAQLQSAIAQAQNEFRVRLDNINSQRFELAQNKAMAKLDALRELRNQTYAMQAQATQYKQQLGLMKEQQTLNLQSSLAQMQAQAQINGQYTPSSYDISASMTNDNNQGYVDPFANVAGSYGQRREDLPQY